MKVGLFSFNGGEVSPLLSSRVDLENLRRCCLRLRNFLPNALGGAFRRPPLLHVAMAQDVARHSRLIPFNFSTTTKYQIEMAHQVLRFRDAATGATAGDDIDAPWSDDEIDEVQFAQINDVVFLTHPDHHPRELLRLPGDVWELRLITWTWPALRDENLDATTLTCSHTTGTGRTLTASAATFQAGHVGSLWQVGHYRDTLSAELTFDPGGGAGQSGTSSAIRVKGRWDFLSVGIWEGSIFLEVRNAAGSWDILRKWTGVKDRNIAASGNEDTEVEMRVRAAGIDPDASSDVAKPRFILEAFESRVYGLVKVTGFTSATSLTVDVVQPLWSTSATVLWSEGAWSAVRGYPRALAIHEQRLVFAGTTSEPQKLWASVTGDFRNFEQTGLEDGAWVYQIAAQEANPIVWLASQTGLIVGTQGDEWLMEGGERGLTPTNATAKRQSRYGSQPVQSLLVGSVVLFVQRGGLSLLEYVFKFDEQNYVAPNLSKLVDHLMRSGVRAMAYAQNPDQVLWCCTNDGQLLSLTYQREEQVLAWAAHPTAGTVESVSVTYGDATKADEVWIVVERFGGRRIERLDAEHWSRLHGTGSEVWHLDAAVVSRAEDEFATLAGLDHLEGQTVRVFADGSEQPSRTVVGGEIDLEVPATVAAAGLAFESAIQPCPLEVPLETGTAQGRKFHVPEFSIRLYRSAVCYFRDREGAARFTVPMRTAAMVMDAAPPLFSGIVRQAACADLNDTVGLILSSDSPAALNVLAIVPTVNVYGN